MLVGIKYAAAAVAVVAFAATAAYSGQTETQSQPATSVPPASSLNPNLVLLDPAHGGSDTGATLGDHLFEKDLTLSFAGRLRSALSAHGFTVISTRDGDAAQGLSIGQRAELANRAHPIACVVIHATRTGAGVHLFTSKLQPAAPPDSDGASSAAFVPIPWETAQAGSVDQSQQMAADLKAALSAGSIPVSFARASVAPIDNLICPAVAVEIAPPQASTDANPIRDAGYQQKIADAMVNGLIAWRKEMTAARQAAQSATPGSTSLAPRVTP